MRSGPFFASYPFQISVRDLGEFEDLYYATCAKLKELYQGIDILVTNGFKDRHDVYFTYREEPLATLGDVGVGEFGDSLVTHANILYSKEVTTSLDHGIKRKNMHARKCGASHETTDSELDKIPYFHPGIWGEKEARAMNRNRQFMDNLAWLRDDVKGLQDMGNMNCAMTFAMLAEKYRPMLAGGELDWATRPSTSPPTPPHGMKEWIAHLDRPDTPEPPQMNDHVAEDEFLRLMYPSKYPTNDTPYVSPYNLEERAKKLNNPDGPEKPCICDEDCICAALCASDPTQNCLCEENSLFVRVTEGMDIDDLDVPDLVRRRSQTSVSTRSSETTTARLDESFVEETADADPVIDAQPAAQIVDQDDAEAANEISEQTSQQKDLTKDLVKQVAQFDDAASISGSIKSLLHSMYSDDFNDAASVAPSTKSGRFNDAASVAPSTKSGRFNDAASVAPSTKSGQFSDAASITPSMASSLSNDDVSMTGIFDSFPGGARLIVRGPDGTPLHPSSQAYRDALRQPFAKECPHAPKRASRTQRMFSSLSGKDRRRR